jgi:hypothetical protein
VLSIVVVMTVILLLAGLVLVYVAFPHRGEKVPAAPWLGEAMQKATASVPTMDSEQDHEWSLRR